MHSDWGQTAAKEERGYFKSAHQAKKAVQI